MSTLDFIIDLFCRVDDAMSDVTRPRGAHLAPSELVTIGLLYALKGGSTRAFYRWLVRDYQALFPRLPERTRLFRLLATYRHWMDRFLASPTVLGVADSYGIELLHPRREKRSSQQMGKKGKSNQRWIVGGKLCLIVNQQGLIVAWACAPANVHDSTFQPLIAQFADEMIVLTDQGFHAKVGDPPNLKVCPRGTWNERMLVERVLAMLTQVCHCKKMTQRVWDYFQARLAATVALFNLLCQWHGVNSFSLAEFSL